MLGGALTRFFRHGSFGHGSFAFENKGANWGVAEVRPAGRIPIPGLAGRVSITINSFNDSKVYWNDANTAENARTLLHELGHAYNFLRGSGGFSLSNLSELGDEYAFDKLIEKDCLPK